MRPSRKTRVALSVSGLLCNIIGAVLLLSLSPSLPAAYTNPNATLFIVWHRSVGFYAAIAALLLGFLLQLFAALRD